MNKNIATPASHDGWLKALLPALFIGMIFARRRLKKKRCPDSRVAEHFGLSSF